MYLISLDCGDYIPVYKEQFENMIDTYRKHGFDIKHEFSEDKACDCVDINYYYEEDDEKYYIGCVSVKY